MGPTEKKIDSCAIKALLPKDNFPNIPAFHVLILFLREVIFSWSDFFFSFLHIYINSVWLVNSIEMSQFHFRNW